MRAIIEYFYISLTNVSVSVSVSECQGGERKLGEEEEEGEKGEDW